MARRIVTGNSSNGKSHLVHDGPSPTRLDMGVGVVEQLWIDDPAKPDPTAFTDPVDVEKVYLQPRMNGSCFKIVTYCPEGHTSEISPEELARTRSRFDDGGVREPDHPGMHTTRTIDYAIVLSGEIGRRGRASARGRRVTAGKKKHQMAAGIGSTGNC